MAKRSIAIGLTIVVLAGAGLSGGWLAMAKMTEASIDKWSRDAHADGIAASWSEVQISGFPFRVTSRFSAPVIALPSDTGLQRWQAPDLTVSYFLFSPNRLRIDAPGSHIIAYAGDGQPDGQASIELSSARLDLHIAPDDDFPDEIELHLSGLTARMEDGSEWHIDSLAVEFKRREPGSAAEPTTGSDGMASAVARLHLTGLEIPASLAGIFDPNMDRLDLDLALAGDLPIDDLWRAEAGEFAAWRDDGGFVQVRAARLDWGTVSARAQGQLKLDQDLQLQGRIEARATGLLDIVQTMHDAQMIGTNTATIARLAIVGFGTTGPPADPPDGAPDEADPIGGDAVNVTFSISDAAVFLGPVRLLRIPPLNWQ